MMITIGRKPFKGSVSETVKKGNCGGINISLCRIPLQGVKDKNNWHSNREKTEYEKTVNVYNLGLQLYSSYQDIKGRFPANLLLSKGGASILEAQSGASRFFKVIQ